MDLELLIGHPLDPRDLNDDQFGRLLDRLYESGCDNLFHDLAISVRTTFSLPASYVLHSDTTSHVLYGEYSACAESDVPLLQITYGYSKDKRPDLKQIMTGMLTDDDGLPISSTTLDGNTADCTYNEQMLSLLQSVYGSELQKYTYIADSKLMTKENLLALTQGEFPISFISRLPSNFSNKLSERMKCEAYEQDQWNFLGTCCATTPGKKAPVYDAVTIPTTVYGTDMYVHVYKTTDKSEKVEKKVVREREKLETEVKHVCKREFFCEADAIAEMNAFLASHSALLNEVELAVTQEVTVKKPRGRPGKEQKAPLEVVRWKIGMQGIQRKEESIAKEIEKASTFCLITNIPSTEKSSREILLLYKGQSHVENQFSILKQPVMAATIFLETPERIKALMTLIYFSALMHGILRVISRIELEKEETPPRWGKERRPLIRPTSETMLWILQMFRVVMENQEMRIEAKDPEMAKWLERILKIVRFDPEFM